MLFLHKKTLLIKEGLECISIMIKQELFQEALSHQRIVSRELLQLLRMLHSHLMLIPFSNAVLPKQASL